MDVSVWIALSVLFIALVAAIVYVWSTRRSHESTDQGLVKHHSKIAGVKNTGSSMDDKPNYTLKYSKMGL